MMPSKKEAAASGSARERKSGRLSGSDKRAKSRGHWIQAITTSSLPSHVISLSCEAVPLADAPGQSRYEFKLKKWSTVRRSRRADRDDDLEHRSGSDAASFWLEMQRIATKGRRVWILSTDAGACFRLLEGWEYSDAGLISWGTLTAHASAVPAADSDSPYVDDCSLILSHACTILTHRIHQARLTWVSTTNYLPTDFAEWSAAVGVDYPETVNVGPGGTSFQSDAALSASVIDRYFARLMGRYLRDGGGHWRATAAQLAHQTWRRSHYTHPVLAHGDRTAYAMERESLFGGRAEVNFYGTVGEPPGRTFQESAGPEPASLATLRGPVYSFDVRSQYPAILRDRPFPVAFNRMYVKPSIPFLETHCKHAAVIARVEIQTPSPDYPLRIGGTVRVRKGETRDGFGRREEHSEKQVCFPVGRYWTTLCGPELFHAIQRDRVVRCSVASTYSAAPAFKSYAGAMIAERESARGAGDVSRESLCKLLANSFVGKFASKGGGWKTRPGKMPPEPWGEWKEIDAETEIVTSWRSLSGVSQEWEPTPTEPIGVPSIFAYCTSYGRVQILEMMETVGSRGWIYCHTDGIVLTKSGRAKLHQSSIRTSGMPGEWREIGELERVRAWGPAHYFADGAWTLSGWTDGVWLDTRGTVFDWRRDEVSRLIADRGKAGANFTLRRSILSASIPSGSVGPDGWHIPPTIRDGEREPSYVRDA